MPVLSTADVTKYIEFGVPYTSPRFIEQIDKLHGRSVRISGLEVRPIPNNPNAVFVYPGRALIRGIVVEVTATQTLAIPATTPPLVVYIDTVDEDDTTSTTLDFAAPDSVPVGAAKLAEVTTSTERTLGSKGETLRGRTVGVKGRRLQRSGAGGQTIFPFRGLAFEPGSDELFIFADRELKQQTEFTLQGMKTLTLAASLPQDLYLEVLVSNQMRFRETITNQSAVLVNLSGSNSYTPGLQDMLVFKNGVLQVPDVDYTEISSTSVNFTILPVTSDVFEFFGVNGLVARETVSLVSATDVDLAFSAYRPGTHSAWVFAGGFKLAATIGYEEVDAELIRLSAAFTGDVHVVILESIIPQTDVTRELGEFFSLGRDFADAILDPDGNRPALVAPDRDNPFATVLDVTTNQEVVDARGNFPTLNDRITAVVDADGILVTHGALHAEDGSDPVPLASALAGGLMSAADKIILDAHIGSRGEDQHAVALGEPSPEAGFLSGIDKAKLDAISLLLQPRGAWGVRFYTDTSQGIDPDLLSGQQKGSLTFLYPALDGSVHRLQTASSEPLSFTTRYTMTVDVGTGETIFFSLLFVLMTNARVWVDGVDVSTGFASPGSGRREGSFALGAGAGRRIDVVFYGGGSGSISGTAASFQTDLLNSAKDVTFVSVP